MSHDYTKPWTEITDHLNEKYTVLDTFSLDAYWHSMDALHSRLAQFRSKAFKPNEKLICYFFDTEFVLNTVGFNIYNLQLILADLDIAQSAIIMITSHYGIEKAIHQLGNDLCNDSWPMPVLSSSYMASISNADVPYLHDPGIDKIQFPFICLNGAQRLHRLMLLCCLEKFDLLDKGIVTWNFARVRKPNILEPIHNDSQSGNPPCFLTLDPPTSINDNICWSNDLRTTYREYHSKFYNQTDSTQPIEKYNVSCRVDDHMLKSFLYVVTETVFDYPYCCITEKTFKAFLNKRPFVIVGPPGMLKQIKQLGFKTFDQVFDESYDDISDPSDRLNKIVDIVKHVASLPIDEIKKIMVGIQPILDFNYDYYYNNFCQVDLEKALATL